MIMVMIQIIQLVMFNNLKIIVIQYFKVINFMMFMIQ
jgi:hypothetical protein